MCPPLLSGARHRTARIKLCRPRPKPSKLYSLTVKSSRNVFGPENSSIGKVRRHWSPMLELGHFTLVKQFGCPPAVRKLIQWNRRAVDRHARSYPTVLMEGLQCPISVAGQYSSGRVGRSLAQFCMVHSRLLSM